eukprot:TRINITY_DN3500_c0_g2_i2.p1 TRINITY_DN3500_c0_g2~~TRINITY_DN3500_c0_g2_i2.p1  ORF type:complete len:481 (-),score=125.53 TRINITY_DN3500_c0_g2_i2:88-1530(-)
MVDGVPAADATAANIQWPESPKSARAGECTSADDENRCADDACDAGDVAVATAEAGGASAAASPSRSASGCGSAGFETPCIPERSAEDDSGGEAPADASPQPSGDIAPERSAEDDSGGEASAEVSSQPSSGSLEQKNSGEEAQPVLQRPARPKTAFFHFLETSRAQLAAELAEESGARGAAALARLAGARWRSMTPELRAPFELRASEALAAYREAIAALPAEALASKPRRSKKQSRRKGRESPGEGADASTPAKRRRLARETLSPASGRGAAEPEDLDVERTLEEDLERVIDMTEQEGASGRRDPPTLEKKDGPPPLTPQKKEARVCFSLYASMVLAGSAAAAVETGERLVVRIRRDRGVQRAGATPGGDAAPTPTPATMAVYDASLGCHLGQLPEAVASVLVPLLERHPSLRLRGRLLAPDAAAAAAANAQEASAAGCTEERPIELALTAPPGLRAELADLGVGPAWRGAGLHRAKCA